MMCTCKVDRKGGITMCKLKGWMDKGRHYVEIKRWMQMGVLGCAN